MTVTKVLRCFDTWSAQYNRGMTKPKSKKKVRATPSVGRQRSFVPFTKGVGILCFVVKVPYRGVGAPRMILHEATVEGKSFAYGNKRHWVV